MPKLHDNGKTVEDELDRLQQYSRRNYLLLHGIDESNHENTDDLVLNTLNTESNLDLTINYLDWPRRTGKACVIEESRPIIVKYFRYMVHTNVFNC